MLVMLLLEDFYNRLRHFPNSQNVVSIRSRNVYTILLFLLFSLLYLPLLFHVLFALFILVTNDVVYVNLVILKHIEYSYHFLELNYKGLNLNFLKLKQLLIDADMESNPGLLKMIANLQLDTQRKLKCLKEQQKSVITVQTMLMLLLIQRCKFIFSIQVNQST